jgi:nucleoside-diphosphate-sugar epimerase
MDSRKYSSVLITGGRGFIGRAVVRELRCTGYTVVSLDQSPAPTTRQSGPEEINLDITDDAQLRQIYASRDIAGIIHLAAILPTAAQSDPERATRVNIDGSLTLLEMARRFGVRRFIFGSSLSVYGSRAANRHVSEQDRPAPEDLYGAAKNYVEQLGDAYRNRDEVEFVSLRIGRVVGPGARSTSSAWRSQIFELLDTKSAARIELPYRGSESLLMVHVDDVARALVTLLFAPHPRYPVYNVPCEAVLVNELKREIESLNPNITLHLGKALAKGNPRLLDATRFQIEFNFRALPLHEQLRNAATSS